MFCYPNISLIRTPHGPSVITYFLSTRLLQLLLHNVILQRHINQNRIFAKALLPPFYSTAMEKLSTGTLLFSSEIIHWSIKEGTMPL